MAPKAFLTSYFGVAAGSSASRFGGVGRRGRGGGHGRGLLHRRRRQRRADRNRRRRRQQCELLLHQLHLLRDDLLHRVPLAAAQARPAGLHGRQRCTAARLCRLRRRRGDRGAGDCRDRVGRQRRVEELRQRIEAAIALHQLPEGEVDLEGLLDLQRGLRERERVEADLDEGRGAVDVGHVDTGEVLEQLAQARDEGGAARREARRWRGATVIVNSGIEEGAGARKGQEIWRRQRQQQRPAPARCRPRSACARRDRWAGARAACARACRGRPGRSRRPAPRAGRRRAARRALSLPGWSAQQARPRARARPWSRAGAPAWPACCAGRSRRRAGARAGPALRARRARSAPSRAGGAPSSADRSLPRRVSRRPVSVE